MRIRLENQQKFNDLVFTNRNKNYGAFVLRSEYSHTLLKSLVILIFIALAGEAALLIYSRLTPIQTHPTLLLPPEQIFTVTEVNNTGLEPSKATKSSDVPKQPKSETQSLLIVRDTVINELELDTIQTNATHRNQNINALSNSTLTDSGDGGSERTGRKDKTENNEIALIPDEMPEFEGGLQALSRFIASEIRYPNDAIEHAKQGKISVKFIVDENGFVILPHVLNHLGYGLDEEALRVVGKIPKFKSPAKVGNKAVKCYYVIPIRFKLY